MDSFEIVKICVRRWWVTLPVLVIAALAGVGLIHQQLPTYYGFGSYALVYTHGEPVPATGGDPRNNNPLAANGAVLLGEALVSDFMSGASQSALGNPGTTGYAPSDPSDDSFFRVSQPEGASTYLTETWGSDPAVVRSVVDRVLAAAPAKAAATQDRAGAPENSQYTTFVTAPTQVVKIPPQSRMKMLLAVSAVGLMAGAALALVVDRLLERRSRRRRGKGRPESGDERDDSVFGATPTPTRGDAMLDEVSPEDDRLSENRAVAAGKGR